MSAKPVVKAPAKKPSDTPANKPADAPKAAEKPKLADKPEAKQAPQQAPQQADKQAPQQAPPKKPEVKQADKPAAKPKAAEKPADGKTDDAPGRVQLANVLHINISQARCATHLKQHLGDEATEAQVKTLRGELKVALEKGDATATADLRAKLTAAAKTLVRISSETPIAVAVVWDCAVKELLRRGMDRAIAADRKIVDIGHIHEGEVLSLGPLYAKCPIWASYDPEAEAAQKKDKGAAKAEEVEPADAAEADESSKNSFYTYVENALKTVKKEDAYKTMRVSNRVREYVAELVAQGIARNTALSRIIVQRIVGVRTMNADHVKVVVNMLMADAGRSAAEVGAVTSLIDEKLALYHNHLKSEREKKVRTLDASQLEAHTAKQNELQLARKKKLAELMRKRAVDSANAHKALNAEIATLEPQVRASA